MMKQSVGLFRVAMHAMKQSGGLFRVIGEI